MNIIVDECLPNRLSKALIGHNAILVQKAGFSGYKDKALLEAIEGHYDVFITIDSNLIFQQNLEAYTIAIIVLHAASNTFEDLKPLVPEILRAVEILSPSAIVHIPELET